MFTPYNEQTASTEDRIAWTLCQILDDDAPLRWMRYRSVAACLAMNSKLFADLQALRESVKLRPHADSLIEGRSPLVTTEANITEEREAFNEFAAAHAGSLFTGVVTCTQAPFYIAIWRAACKWQASRKS